MRLFPKILNFLLLFKIFRRLFENLLKVVLSMLLRILFIKPLILIKEGISISFINTSLANVRGLRRVFAIGLLISYR